MVIREYFSKINKHLSTGKVNLGARRGFPKVSLLFKKKRWEQGAGRMNHRGKKSIWKPDHSPIYYINKARPLFLKMYHL